MKKFFGFSSSTKKQASSAKIIKRGSSSTSGCSATDAASTVSSGNLLRKNLGGMEISTVPPPKQSSSKPTETPKFERVKLSDPHLPLIIEYMRCMNAHDFKSMAAICTKDISFDFIDSAFPWEFWETEVGNLFKAFPDFKFEWDDIVYGEDGVLILQEFQASGTHTACPYGFGPYPEIVPTGIKVKNDPEVLHFHFRDKKISKILFVTKGRLTGPSGVYTQLGGFALQ